MGFFSVRPRYNLKVIQIMMKVDSSDIKMFEGLYLGFAVD